MSKHVVRRMARVGGGIAIVAMLCAYVPAQSVAAVTQTRVTPGDVDAATAPAPEAVADWREPTASANASPTEIVEGALKESGKKPNSKIKIVYIIKKNGKPVIKTQTVTGAADAKNVVKKAQDDPRLLAVEVDSNNIRVLGENAPASDVPKTTAPGVASTNDTYWGSMWGLHRLNAESVWTTTSGSSAVKVAVLDTGVSAHVDLPEARILAGTDTSGDGGSNGRSDGNGHGTHVTGTIVASVNNGIGVAGLAPSVTILPVKVLTASGSGSDSGVARGIIYAANQGADVINMSLGGGYSSVIATAIAYAITEGSLPVAAAGNSRASGSPVSYPAALPGVLGVAATTSNDSYASFSNAGSYVDISAPGQGIWSTLPGNTYSAWSGTSMATPHVSAVAALVISEAASRGVIGIPIDVLLTTTADDLGPSGWDQDYGAGMIDPVGALAELGTPSEEAPRAPTGVAVSQVAAQEATVSWNSGGGAAARSYVVSGEPNSIVCTSVGTSTNCRLTGLDAQTRYTVAVEAINLGGTSPKSVNVSFTTLARQDAASDDFDTPTPITPGTPVNEVIDSADDLDHWGFTSPAAGNVTVNLTNLPLDYDLFVLDSNGVVKGYSWNWNTTSEYVQVSLPAGQYVALVKPYNNDGSSSPYRLSVAVPSAPRPTPPRPTPPRPTPPRPTPPTPPTTPRPTPPKTITRVIKVRGKTTTLPKRATSTNLRWVNQTPGKCELVGRKVTGKQVGTCKLDAYAVGRASLGVRLKASVTVLP